MRRHPLRSGAADARKGGMIALALLVCSALTPGLAAAQSAPGADTPVAPQYQDSYKLYLAMKAKAHIGKVTFTTLPDWGGLWTRGMDGGLKFDPKQPGGLFDPPKPTATADLTPEYRKKYLDKIDQFYKGNEWDPLSACLPAGYPRWLTEPFLREFILRPEETWWLTEQNSEVRRIYTDGRGHVPEDEAYPLWEGDSIGFWDGDTLVVHTIHVKPGQYQRNQPDYSVQASTVERIRKIDKETIEDDVTVFDPPSLKTPWHVVQHYVREHTPHARIDQWSCEENNNVIKTPEGGSNFILPGEKGYKDPNALTGPPTPSGH